MENPPQQHRQILANSDVFFGGVRALGPLIANNSRALDADSPCFGSTVNFFNNSLIPCVWTSVSMSCLSASKSFDDLCGLCKNGIVRSV